LGFLGLWLRELTFGRPFLEALEENELGVFEQLFEFSHVLAERNFEKEE